MKNKNLEDQIEAPKRTFSNNSFHLHFASDLMKLIVISAKKYSQSNANVLILGENGVGKEVIAHIIHKYSKRSNNSFFKINCASIPETLFESELFGYEKGAFTGAQCDKDGKLKIADGGTIFLDEIGELPLSLQPKLLRAIENKEITPIGSNKTYNIDVRIIAATNRDLAALVGKSLFREDLFFRLNVLSILIPPLRERKEDIPSLVHHFLTIVANEENGVIKSISDEALESLVNYSFPGNIRELKNLIHRVYLLCDSDMISRDCIEKALKNKSNVFEVSVENEIPLNQVKKNVEKEYVIQLLKQNDNNVSKVSNLLNIDKSTLFKKIKQLGIKR